jgi:hypothetical protein
VPSNSPPQWHFRPSCRIRPGPIERLDPNQSRWRKTQCQIQIGEKHNNKKWKMFFIKKPSHEWKAIQWKGCWL